MPPVVLPFSYVVDQDFLNRMWPIWQDHQYIRLVWARVKPSTRQTYAAAITSFEAHSQYYNPGKSAWPATFDGLRTWLQGRAYGNPMLPKQKQVSHATLSGYLAALRSVHVDMNFGIEIFSNPHLRGLIDAAANLFPREPPERKCPMDLPTMAAVLSPDAAAGEHPDDTLNLNAAYACAWGGMMRLGEITEDDGLDDYTRRSTQLTGRCLTMSPTGDHAKLLLPRSKTDRANKGVEITLTPSGDSTCALLHFNRLLETGVGPTESLFKLRGKKFNKTNVRAAFHARLQRLGITGHALTGHSFRRGAAQHAANNGVTRENIQALGRWSSEAVDRYYLLSPDRLYAIHQQFVTGQAVPIRPRL